MSTRDKKQALCPACGGRLFFAHHTIAEFTADPEPFEPGKEELPAIADADGGVVLGEAIYVDALICEKCHKVVDVWIGDQEQPKPKTLRLQSELGRTRQELAGVKGRQEQVWAYLRSCVSILEPRNPRKKGASDGTGL